MPPELEGYNKVASIFELQALGLPTQAGYVVLSWNRSVEATIARFARDGGWAHLLVRSDERPERLNSPLGGHTATLSTVSDEVRGLLAQGRVVILTEPANRYTNLYGVNIQIARGNRVALIEAVGPGFDVTDIDRGEVTPHERIQLEIRDDQVTSHVLERTLVDDESYRRSVRVRLRKVGRLAIRGLDKAPRASQRRLEAVGENYLQEHGYEALLDNRRRYLPMPAQCVARLVAYVRDLPWRLLSGSSTREIVVSASVLEPQSDPRFIFWDIVRPETKYGTR